MKNITTNERMLMKFLDYFITRLLYESRNGYTGLLLKTVTQLSVVLYNAKFVQINEVKDFASNS